MANNSLVENQPKRIAWGALVWAIICFYLAVQVAQLALYLGRWPVPIRYVSLLCLLIFVLFISKGLAGLLEWGRTLSLKGFAIRFLLLFIAIVFVVGITNPDHDSPTRTFRNAVVVVSGGARQWIADGFREVVRFPSQFWIAYTGQAPGNHDNADKVVVSEDNMLPIAVPPIDSSSKNMVTLGNTVSISGQAGSRCNMSSFWGDEPFAAGSSVVVWEGPKLIQGEWWWRVRGANGIGWCPNAELVTD